MYLAERKLLIAVLRRALFDYFGNKKSDKASAAEWLFDESSSTELFSFNWVCEQLGFEPKHVLSRILQLPPRKGMAAQKWWYLQGLTS